MALANGVDYQSILWKYLDEGGDALRDVLYLVNVQ